MENMERNNIIPEGERKRRKDIVIASPVGGGQMRQFEAEYWEIYPGVWEKIPGSERDLGPAKQE